jgi:peptidoglycan hydrolase-like protein with peptidoglycan-binding domain
MTADLSVAPGTTPSDPVLRRGSKGPDVRRLQQALVNLGFDPGSVDGDFGPRTEKAVRGYQTSRGLAVDGIVGPKTWAALHADGQ